MWTQLWLVTDYHENGSLFDFLSKCVVTPSQVKTLNVIMDNVIYQTFK
jgi:hypothetical protein